MPTDKTIAAFSNLYAVTYPQYKMCHIVTEIVIIQQNKGYLILGLFLLVTLFLSECSDA